MVCVSLFASVISRLSSNLLLLIAFIEVSQLQLKEGLAVNE